MEDILNEKSIGTVGKIIITEAIAAAVIIISILAVKLFFPDLYGDIKKLYTDKVCVETTVDEVLGSQ